MRVLVCGDREWNVPAIVNAVLSGLYAEWKSGLLVGLPLDEFVVIEGDARGADRVAGDWAERTRAIDPIGHMKVEAMWRVHDRAGDTAVPCRCRPGKETCNAAGVRRNAKQLAEGRPNLVLAFHDDLEHSKGTGDMVKRSRKADVPVYNIRRIA